MNKYKATAYTHGIPKDAGRPIRSVTFEAANYLAARREAERKLKGQSVIGVTVVA